jgi:hypothetical protein
MLSYGEENMKKKNNNNKKIRNISYRNIFNVKIMRIKTLKGDEEKLNNDKLEKKLYSSIKKKNNIIINKINNHILIPTTFMRYNNNHSFNINKNYRCNSINIKSKNTESSNKEMNVNSNYIKINLESDSIENMNSNENNNKLILQESYKKGLVSLDKSDIINIKDKNNPYIYSYYDWHPYSFCTGHRKWGYENGKLKAPSPIFIDNEEWCQKKQLSKQEILRGILIKDNVGLLLVDPLICAKFTGMLSDLIKQILKVVFGHKISLNVKLFEPSSLTRTLLNYFSFIPKFLLPITYNNTNPLERMKFVISLGISGLYMNAKQLKPFNPLICETFQGFFDLENINEDNKIELFSEQISNYPTLTRYYILNKHFKMYGYFDLSIETKNFGNKIICFTKGINTVDFFKINEKIYFSIPSSKIVNAIAKDDRSAHYVGSMIFYDLKNNLRAFVQFAKDPKHIADIKGYIFKYNFPENYKFNFDKEYEMFERLDVNNFKKNRIFSKDDVLSTISGSWLDKLYFDEVKYWDIDEDIPTYIRPVYSCLPSDSRFREDLIWLYRSFYKSQNEEERLYYERLAQNWKLMIEKVQREERTEKAKLNEELAKKLSLKKK